MKQVIRQTVLRLVVTLVFLGLLGVTEWLVWHGATSLPGWCILPARVVLGAWVLFIHAQAATLSHELSQTEAELEYWRAASDYT